VNLFGLTIVEHANFPDPETVLRLPETAKPFDAAAADLSWLMAKVLFDSIANLGSNSGAG